MASSSAWKAFGVCGGYPSGLKSIKCRISAFYGFQRRNFESLWLSFRGFESHKTVKIGGLWLSKEVYLFDQ
jgi:hypothetical protein